jgi:hypothetical protein
MQLLGVDEFLETRQDFMQEEELQFLHIAA